MICPFCQCELDVELQHCPNCAAAVPHKGPEFGVKLRTLMVSGSMLLIATMILNNCVINYLPGGTHSAYFAPGSPQAALGPGPNMKSADAQALLQKWTNNQQMTQNPNGPIRPSKRSQ